jgi:hypothetical protein
MSPTTSKHPKAIETALARMVASGCLIEVRVGDQTYTQMLGKALLVQGGLFWCRTYPEDQHHYHLTKFRGTPRLEGDEFILPQQKGRIVPFAYSKEFTEDKLLSEFQAWLTWMRQNGGTKSFRESFFHQLAAYTNWPCE